VDPHYALRTTHEDQSVLLKDPRFVGFARIRFPLDILRKRKADLERIAMEFKGCHEAFKSLDPVGRKA
jgi:hypothetical protein